MSSRRSTKKGQLNGARQYFSKIEKNFSQITYYIRKGNKMFFLINLFESVSLSYLQK